MALSSTSRPSIRARVLARLPATLMAIGGLAVSKLNGVWTIFPRWTDLALETTIANPDARQLWVLDPDTDVYTRLSVQVLIDNLPDGPAGPAAGFRQAFDNATTDADPGAGEFRFNHATVSSATAAYLDNVDAEGSTISALIDTFDDSTNTSKGRIRFEKGADPAIFAEFTVTGSVVNGTGYRKLTLTHIASSGTFTATDVFSIAFFSAGDKGADDPSITNDTTTNATMYPTWVTAATGNLPQKVSSTKLSFNPLTGALASTSFNASTGSAGYALGGVQTLFTYLTFYTALKDPSGNLKFFFADANDAHITRMNAGAFLFRDATGATQWANLGASSLALTVPVGMKTYTVATLPAGVAGLQAYATNLRVFNGAGTQEGSGSGTGGVVEHNGSAWKISGTNVTAIA